MVEIQALKDERNRLEKLCLDRHIDPRSRKQKASDKEREQASDDPSRNSSLAAAGHHAFEPSRRGHQKR